MSQTCSSCPTLDAANIAFNLLKAGADGLPIGPILLGMSKAIHVAHPRRHRPRHRQRQRRRRPPGADPQPGRLIPLALGLVAVGALLWGARAFSRASIESLKRLLAWVVALAGLSLVAMLLLTGRGPAALAGLVLIGPLAWSYFQESRTRPAEPGPARPLARMDRREALAVLGLDGNPSDSEIRAAWVHLMRTAHPDGGGTDWLAARVNQAKDVLLKR